MKKRIYISGKSSGLLTDISMKFGTHEKYLLTIQEQPVWFLQFCQFTDVYYEAMKKRIAALIICQEIHMLPDWQEDAGALLEHHIAKELCIKIIYLK